MSSTQMGWRAALEQAAHELDIAENALLCGSFHNAASRAKQAAHSARAALAQPKPEDDVALLRAALKATAAQRRAEDDARAALAQPKPEVVGPSDEEIIQEAIKADLVYRPIDEEPYVFSGFVESHPLNQYVLAFARAVLTRWGRPAPAPAGEVADPMIPFRYTGHLKDAYRDGYHSGYKNGLTRAADLLEQRHPAPVPVSERLPEAKDCLGRPTESSDAGWCWTYSDVSETWSFRAVVFPRPYPDPPLVTLKSSVTHWLPFHALPLPSGEAQS